MRRACCLFSSRQAVCPLPSCRLHGKRAGGPHCLRSGGLGQPLSTRSLRRGGGFPPYQVHFDSIVHLFWCLVKTVANNVKRSFFRSILSRHNYTFQSYGSSFSSWKAAMKWSILPNSRLFSHQKLRSLITQPYELSRLRERTAFTPENCF